MSFCKRGANWHKRSRFERIPWFKQYLTPRLNAWKAKKTAGFYPFFNSNLATLPKPRLYFHKIWCVMSLELYRRWKNFASPFRFGSASTANVSDIRHKTVSPSKNVSSVVRAIHTKDAPKKKQNSPNVLTVQGHMLHLTRGVPNIKKQAFKQHVVNNQKTYAAAVSQKPHPQPKTQTFQFTAEQLTKFVANVAIQIAQPQVCYPNSKQDMLDLKSSMCRKVSDVAKTILGVSITGKELFESIGSLSAPAPPGPLPLWAPKWTRAVKTTHI